MIRRGKSWAPECVLIDLNTQYDFCVRAGADPVANVEALVPALRRVIAWAKRNHAPIVSSLNSHRPYELSEENHHQHCLEGSPGQQKVDFTVMALHARVDVDNTLCVPVDLFRRHQQVIFRERGDNLLGNPKADRFLTQLKTREYLVFGSGVESSVKTLALGLLAREKQVSVIVDACGYWDQAEADFALRQMAAKGATLLTMDKLGARRLARQYRYRVQISVGLPANGKRNGNGRSHLGAKPASDATETPGGNGKSHNGVRIRARVQTKRMPPPASP